MKPTRRRNERTRLLLLELAVVVPALALIAFSMMHLKSIQRDRAVEAAIQRDFNQMLLISEKRMAKRAYQMVETARADFPCPESDVQPKLTKILAQNPWAAYAFVVDEHTGTTFVSQAALTRDPAVRAETDKFRDMISKWLPYEGKEILEKLRNMEKHDERPLYFFSNMVPRGNGHAYQSVALFPIKDVAKDRITLGGIAFDSGYLKDTFFPEMLDQMISPASNATTTSADMKGVALMIHVKKDMEPLAACSNWDGGEPEIQRNMEAAFPGLVQAIKLQGTTVQAISDRFLRTSYIILGGLSLLMAGGIFLTYRSVNKEVALAKLKSDFVSNVSHELRTPLSLIRLYAETLEMGRLLNPEKYQEYYRIIRKESERLTALINNILDFSRIEAGRKEYELRETDLAELVRTTLDSYRYQIEQHGFAFEQSIEEDLPKVEVDREAIARSLLNLVNNAVKYSSKDKYLRVNVYRSNGNVNMEVVDHGIGIPRAEQNKIFEKFYRASDPLVHNTKGSGLGLSLVRHVIDAHGGQVSVDSAPGRGSKFTIILPVNTASKTAKVGTAS
jgi:signal transduction histidine kinase